jgi:hypothetical protein
MFLRIKATAALASFSVLAAACTAGSPNFQQSSGVAPVPPDARISAGVTPDKACGGTGGVKVTPCPIVLTQHTKPGIVVTVSGPGVVHSYLGRIKACFSGHNCYNAERVGSSQTRWRITSGRACGRADVEFLGVNARAQEVGYAFLMVTNKYCP